MAAANSSFRGVTSFGKRVATQIFTPTRSAPALRRSLHSSVYDKNVEDHVRPAVVPDEIIQADQPEKYWAPNPQTGVFGPASELNPGGSGERGFHSSPTTNGGSESVLEQKAFFRPLEDLDKPQHP